MAPEGPTLSQTGTMTREITDPDGTTWTLAQAFAGLGLAAERADAARVMGTADRVHVVCTPSGGAQSVRVELREGWEDAPEEELLDALRAASA